MKLMLPPGWKEKAGAKKGRYRYGKHDAIKQDTHPCGEWRLYSAHVVRLAGQEQLLQCLKHLNKLTDGADMPEERRVPYAGFGVDLDVLMDYEESMPPRTEAAPPSVPRFVERVVCHVAAHGTGEKGVFRCAGEKRAMDALVEMVDSGRFDSLSLPDAGLHNLCGVLKQYLRELPQPVIPFAQYEAFLHVALLADRPAQQRAELAALVAALPRRNLCLLERLLGLLRGVACNKHVNAMDETNLAIVTAPNILRPARAKAASSSMIESTQANGAVAALITHYAELFERGALAETLRQLNHREHEWVLYRTKLLGHTKSIRAVVPHPAARTVLTVDRACSLALWDADALVCKKQATHSNIRAAYTAILVPTSSTSTTSNSGEFWVAAAEGVLMFDTRTLEQRRTLPYTDVYAILVVGGEVWLGLDGRVVVVDAASGAQIAVVAGLGVAVSALALVPDTGVVWAAGVAGRASDGEAYLLRCADHALCRKVPHGARLVHCAEVVSRRGRMCEVWLGTESGIEVWDAAGTARLAALATHNQPVHSLCVLPEAVCGDQVWAGLGGTRVAIWQAAQRRCVGELAGYHADFVLCMAPVVSSDPASDHCDVWTGSADYTVCVWRAWHVDSVAQ